MAKLHFPDKWACLNHWGLWKVVSMKNNTIWNRITCLFVQIVPDCYNGRLFVSFSVGFDLNLDQLFYVVTPGECKLMLGQIYHKNPVLPVWQSASSWWWHQLETFSILLALCVWNSLVTSEFPSQSPVEQSSDVFFDLRLNKQLSEQLRCRWLETSSRSLWYHCNAEAKTMRQHLCVDTFPCMTQPIKMYSIDAMDSSVI